MKTYHFLLLFVIWVAVGGCGSNGNVSTLDGSSEPDTKKVDATTDVIGDEVTPLQDTGSEKGADSHQADGHDELVDTAVSDAIGQRSLLSAGKLTDPDMVPAGYGAYAQPGTTWFIQNDVARFYIQDSDVAVGLDLYGGNLIDGVRLDNKGGMGTELFREMFPIVAFRIPTAAEIAVIQDGSSGDEVVLRVTGTDAKSKIVDLLDVLVGDLAEAQIHTDYIMRPQVPGVLIRTTVSDPKGKLGDLSSVLVGEMLAFGKTLRLFSPETGWDEPGKNGPTSALVGVGNGVSYAYARVTGTFTIPVVDSSGTVALYDGSNIVDESGKMIFERWFMVGTGDVASVLDPLRALRRDAGVVAQGTVVDSVTFEPIPNASVHCRDSVTKKVINHSKTGQNGRFQMDVPPGDVEWVVLAEGRPRYVSEPTTVNKPFDDRFSLLAPGKLALSLKGPAKVSLLGENVESPDPLLGEASFGGQTLVLHHMEGSPPWILKPGIYKATISRGPEYERIVTTIEIQSGVTTTYEGTLARVIDTSGWLGGDFHQHTVGSLDSEQSHLAKIRENLVEGVEIVASTDHDNTTDYKPAIDALNAKNLIYSLVGNEISVNLVGHFNAYPLPLDPSDPYALVGSKLWAGRTIQELLDFLQTLPSDPVIHISHPRSGGKGYFTWLGLEPATATSTKAGTPLADGFDAVEVNAELGEPSLFVPEMDDVLAEWSKSGKNRVPVLRDWFGLLQAGKNICALGNSDSHNFNDGSGYPRTYLRVGLDEPASLTDTLVTSAIRAQKATVARGIFVTISVGGLSHMGSTEPVEVALGDSVDLSVRVQAPDWVTVGTLEVYEKGRPLRLAPHKDSAVFVPDELNGSYTIVAPKLAEGLPALDWNAVVRVSPTGDSWYVVVVRGSGDGKPVFDGQPFGFTNPIYVKVKGSE
ncbi:MAG: CehA/McbA family metallohydrolase [Myxococcales bacterium]|nr:CehA/McbA family metallohydrolase [Myxococcales bacterium]